MEDKIYYIVYKITNKLNGRFYVGVHETDDLDDGYMGSSDILHDAMKKHGTKNFKKEIVDFFADRKQMYSAERLLVDEDFVAREDTYNVGVGGYGGWPGSSNSVIVKNSEGKRFRVKRDDPRYLSGELVSSIKNCVLVVHKNDIDKEKRKVLLMNRDDPRYLSGKYVHVSKNRITVKDKEGRYFSIHTQDPRYISGEFVAVWQGKHHKQESKDKIGKANSVHQKGSGNSLAGKRWMSNDSLRCSKPISKEDVEIYLADGWRLGRKINWSLERELNPR